ATQRNATQRNATQRNATQRNATQRNATQRNANILARIAIFVNHFFCINFCFFIFLSDTKPVCQFPAAGFFINTVIIQHQNETVFI
ncbi:MAG: hypothetical protein FWB82_02630, partial [Treponema sp.]|nr:hypothetical protein [Treponema sp.]